MGIEPVYGGEARRQLGVFHLLREYRRNIGMAGYAVARLLLGTGSQAVRSGMGAADYAPAGRGGALLARESVGEGVASFDDGASQAPDDVAIGAAQPGVAAA